MRIASGMKTAALAAIVGTIMLVAPDLARAQMNGSAQKLDGTWLVTITRIDPPPGVPPTFLSLQMYMQSGEVIETSNTGRTNRSVGLGEWVRTGNREFTNTFWYFRFNPGETYAGLTKVIRNIRVSEDQRRFRAVSIQELYDTAGSLIATRRSTEAGERLALAELDDRPDLP
jgi:hypothetical protein